MKYLKNINPYLPLAITDVVKHKGQQIASKAFIDNENIEIRFFSCANGESIDKEYYQMETIFHVLEGKLKISYNSQDEIILKAGEIVALEADINYGIEALDDTKYLNILVKN